MQKVLSRKGQMPVHEQAAVPAWSKGLHFETQTWRTPLWLVPASPAQIVHMPYERKRHFCLAKCGLCHPLWAIMCCSTWQISPWENHKSFLLLPFWAFCIFTLTLSFRSCVQSNFDTWVGDFTLLICNFSRWGNQWRTVIIVLKEKLAKEGVK